MNIAVVGAGITGLTVAQGLAKKGHQVTVFEKGTPGGLAFGFPMPCRNTTFLDKYYHHVFTGDRACLALIEENGLASEMVWSKTRSALFARGRIQPFDTPLDLLKGTFVGGLCQRVLMGLNLVRLKRATDWKALDGIRCREYFEKRKNAAGYRALWEPLLKQKFADAFDDIPAAFLWGRLSGRMHSRKRGRETLGYLKGGFQRLILAMVESIEKRDARVRANEAVKNIRLGERPEVATGAEKETFDRIVWTAALDLLAEALEGAPEDFARKAARVRHVAVTCLLLVVKRSLGDVYWINNIDPSVSFGAAIEHTNLIAPDLYDGRHILYVSNYHAPGADIGALSPGELLERHVPSLRKVFGGFDRSDVLHAFAFRDTHASPVYDLRFAERMPPYRGWLGAVDICNMAQVYPEDRNMSNCIANAKRYLKECWED